MVKVYRAYWRRRMFWVACFSALAIHLGVFIPILRVYPEFKPIWYLPIIIIEGTVTFTPKSAQKCI